MRRKSPQEKKRLSLLKDRRNTYGENAKASRKGIARHKRDRTRTDRRLRNQPLREATGRRDPEVEEHVEVRRVAAPKSYWKKVPDRPLGEVLEDKLSRRSQKGMVSAPTAEASRRKIRGRTGR